MRQLLESDLTRVYSQWGDASSPLLPFPTDTFRTNCSFCNSMHVLSARAYFRTSCSLCHSDRQGKSLGNALKHRSQLATVAPASASRQSTLCDRIAALA